MLPIRDFLRHSSSGCVILGETKNLKAGTGTISMDANHNPIKQAVILENKNGGREVVAKIVP